MRISWILAAALACGPALADDLPGTTFTFGMWQGGAAADATGGYSHCYATLSYSTGDQFWVNVTRANTIEVVVTVPGHSFAKDQEPPASLMMESGAPLNGKALVLDQTHISFSLSPLNDAHAFLSQGSWLRLMGIGHDEAYEVRGLGGVLGLVRRCHELQQG